ncbi:MAG: shikimate kinase [Ilumatobacteraceae bacterium]|nr:shikimate kinase [Ilumatobacteraceae bacterium]
MNQPSSTHLVLIGLMGSGKTTIGRRVAAQTGRHFYDTDAMVEADCGLKVRQIFAQWGEPEFRRLEHIALITALAVKEPGVIAAAGGVVLSDQNREALQTARDEGRARIVWLKAQTATLLSRVQNGVHRPLLDANPAVAMQAMHDQRTQWYQDLATAVVSTDELSASRVVAAVVSVINEGSSHV